VEAFVKGDVVVLPFPFSAAPGSKRRPAVVVASWTYAGSTDYLVSLISSQRDQHPTTIELDDVDLLGGTLNLKSYIRSPYLFAADESLIAYRIGSLAPSKLAELQKILVLLLS